MKLSMKTTVQQPLQQVWSRFNQQLFEYLNPPFPPAKLLRYDGNTVGDEVHIKLQMGVASPLWVSTIVENVVEEEQCWFVDEGTVLPFFLSSWRHKHLLTAEGEQTVITDLVEFTTPFWLPEVLFYPSVAAQFLYRKPLYKKYYSA
jgi:ligand-binding SRPBCC domain-containing protein